MTHDRRLWPGYVPPQRDELFTSWLMRICRSHEYKSHSFSKFYFGGLPIWNRDLDRDGPSVLKELICSYTFLTPQSVDNLFLKSYEGSIISRVVSNGPSRVILPLGIRHRKRNLYGQMFCPGCLDNDLPYYRKSWRMAFNLMCVSCGFYLWDRCPKCQNAIAFHRLENGLKNSFLKRSLSECYYCQFDLRYAGLLVKSKDLIDYQKRIDEYCDSSFEDTNPSNLPEHYLKLLTLLTQPRGGTNRFQEVFLAQNLLKSYKINAYSNLQVRQEILPQINKHLGSIEALKEFLVNNDIGKSCLSSVFYDDMEFYSKL
jgi:TniQ